jgi:hypothetical protein
LRLFLQSLFNHSVVLTAGALYSNRRETAPPEKGVAPQYNSKSVI